jgi:3-oxoacyl-[acyl-carrier-protein] synthase-3
VLVTTDQEELHGLLLSSARAVLSSVETKDLAVVILYSGIPVERSVKSNRGLEIFDYTLPRLLNDLDLSGCRGYALSQQGCSGLIAAIEFAKDILDVSEKKYALCISGDRFPSHHKREIIYNLVSDATGAILIERNPEKNVILAISHKSNMALWDTSHMEEQILATYFPMATRAIHAALKKENLSVGDIAWFVPHNVSVRSWEMLSQLVPLPLEKVWLKNVSRIGHTVSCDHIINLRDMEDANLLKKGDLLFCFTFGFGAQWSSMIVRH